MELWEKMIWLNRDRMEKVLKKYGRELLLFEFEPYLSSQDDEWSFRLVQLLRDKITIDEYFS